MSLTIVIPTSQADIDRLKFTVDAMEFHGGLERHTVLFCPTPGVAQKAGEQAQRIRAICENTFVEVLPREPEKVGKFGAFNTIFRDTVNLRRMQENKNPWFWWEVDMTTLVAGPWDMLEVEYNRKGKPFMGVRRRAADVMRRLDGTPLPEDDPRAEGDYMVAVGIYPPNFREISTLYRYPDPSGAMPTDVLIRHEVNPLLYNTDLIAHHYATGNYRRNELGMIECDDFKPQSGHPSYGGTLSPMAIVAHGAKDGSLSKLVLSTVASTTGSATATVSSGQADDRLVRSLQAKIEELGQAKETLEKENASLKADIKSLMEGGTDFTASPKAPVQTATSPAASDDLPSKNQLPAIEKLHEALAEKKIMLGDLAADFNVDKADLRRLIETPGSKMGITKGPPWVYLERVA